MCSEHTTNLVEFKTPSSHICHTTKGICIRIRCLFLYYFINKPLLDGHSFSYSPLFSLITCGYRASELKSKQFVQWLYFSTLRHMDTRSVCVCVRAGLLMCSEIHVRDAATCGPLHDMMRLVAEPVRPR